MKCGEDPQAGAVRETGFRCVLGPRFPTAHYQVNRQRWQVSYWAAEAGEGHFVPNREVDRVRWLSPDAARDRLTMVRDRELVDELLAALRHA
ncbi:NUDIX hydrolase [Streptomyces acidicola]|uniref:hypothetical protein n=1 Tax=Streptomyces acidicola TaxID=2596892 RepID=UPI0037F9235F